jgi:hypothetical protein
VAGYARRPWARPRCRGRPTAAPPDRRSSQPRSNPNSVCAGSPPPLRRSRPAPASLPSPPPGSSVSPPRPPPACSPPRASSGLPARRPLPRPAAPRSSRITPRSARLPRRRCASPRRASCASSRSARGRDRRARGRRTACGGLGPISSAGGVAVGVAPPRPPSGHATSPGSAGWGGARRGQAATATSTASAPASRPTFPQRIRRSRSGPMPAVGRRPGRFAPHC